jgi:hypothetical protein
VIDAVYLRYVCHVQAMYVLTIIHSLSVELRRSCLSLGVPDYSCKTVF